MTVRLSECPHCQQVGPDNEPCPCQLTPEQREIRSLRKRLAEASVAVKVQAQTLAHARHALEQSRQDVAAAEQRAAKARADFTAEHERGVLNRREARLKLAHWQGRAERAERELERWRLRLRDRARRREEETEGPDGGIDWLERRALVRDKRDRKSSPLFHRLVVEHLQEPAHLPMSDAECREMAARLGIDLVGWVQQIYKRAREALEKLEDSKR